MGWISMPPRPIPVTPSNYDRPHTKQRPDLRSDEGAGIFPFRDAEGNLITPEPWSVASPASQWQAQFGVQVTFGGS
jgi:hypothetical protein